MLIFCSYSDADFCSYLDADFQFFFFVFFFLCCWVSVLFMLIISSYSDVDFLFLPGCWFLFLPGCWFSDVFLVFLCCWFSVLFYADLLFSLWCRFSVLTWMLIFCPRPEAAGSSLSSKPQCCSKRWASSSLWDSGSALPAVVWTSSKVGIIF